MSEMDDRETWYRVPRSAEECAVHLEAGGVVEAARWGNWGPTMWGNWGPTISSPMDFRKEPSNSFLPSYRLVYSTPVGMSPVTGAPGHAYGLAKQAPGGWLMTGTADGSTEGWVTSATWVAEDIIEARPPTPAPEPRTEMVPLTKLVGRTLVGETKPVHSWWPCEGGTYAWCVSMRERTKELSVDVESGLVEVLAEEEA